VVAYGCICFLFSYYFLFVVERDSFFVVCCVCVCVFLFCLEFGQARQNRILFYFVEGGSSRLCSSLSSSSCSVIIMLFEFHYVLFLACVVSLLCHETTVHHPIVEIERKTTLAYFILARLKFSFFCFFFFIRWKKYFEQDDLAARDESRPDIMCEIID
jgi:hypothetical protein